MVRSALKVAKFTLILVGAILALQLFSFWNSLPVNPIPEFEAHLENPIFKRPVKILDKTGNISLCGEFVSNQQLKNLSDYSPYVIKALIAWEDSRFDWHFGFEPLGTMASLIANLTSKNSAFGGSTITQQLSRIIYPQVGRDDSYLRKIKELVASVKLEFFYSKDDILLLYLNRVTTPPSSNFGVESASQYYFGKSSTYLQLNEAATLVRFLKSPSLLYKTTQERDKILQDEKMYDLKRLEADLDSKKINQAKFKKLTKDTVAYYANLMSKTIEEQRNQVLKKMYDLKLISRNDYNTAARLTIQETLKDDFDRKQERYTYFCDYIVKHELGKILDQTSAKGGDLIIVTTLDAESQRKQDRVFNTYLSGLNDKDIHQGASVILDKNNGGIIAMSSASTSEYNFAIEPRQPASTFKVFTYGVALDKGFDLNDKISCDNFIWELEYAGCHNSLNPMSVLEGLAQSENVIALRLAKKIGLSEIRKSAEIAEVIDSNDKLDSPGGFILGGKPTSLLNMTSAYSAVNDLGTWMRPHGIVTIYDSSKCKNKIDLQSCAIIYKYDKTKSRNNRTLFKSSTSQKLTRALKDAVTSGTAQASGINTDAAGKTGTSNERKDLWFIGFVPNTDSTIGVWLGNDDNSITDGTNLDAVNLWKEIVDKIM